MTRTYETPLQLPPGFRINKQVDIERQWSYASSHYGWCSRWFDEETYAVKAARRRLVYLTNKDRAGEVFP